MTISDSPRISAGLMIATYVTGTAGVAWGFFTVFAEPPSLSAAALLAVGAAGGLSFVRHSIFHRSDAARMNWDLGRRNNFQIEVGIANLAWAVLAVLAVSLGWGVAAEAASLLVFGLYLLGVSVFLLLSPGDGARRGVGPTVGMISFGAALTVLGVIGMTVVT